MPKDKDFKKLVRERMAKTGESYTAARMQLLAKRSHGGERLSEEQLAELAGLSTEAVLRATQHDWSWWLDYLDGAGFRKSEHREITRHVEEHFDISAWWVQSAVVGYERILGDAEQLVEASVARLQAPLGGLPQLLLQRYDERAQG